MDDNGFEFASAVFLKKAVQMYSSKLPSIQATGSPTIRGAHSFSRNIFTAVKPEHNKLKIQMHYIPRIFFAVSHLHDHSDCDKKVDKCFRSMIFQRTGHHQKVHQGLISSPTSRVKSRLFRSWTRVGNFPAIKTIRKKMREISMTRTSVFYERSHFGRDLE